MVAIIRETGMILTGYTQFGGQHPETAALRNILAFKGLRAPHTGEPFSEAMLFGIGGGLGIGYILWQFQEHNAIVIVLGFRQNWQYTVKYLQALSDRLGARAVFQEGGGKSGAAKNLAAALAAGDPPLAWVDQATLPYFQLPESLKDHLSHLVGVVGIDAESVMVDDLAPSPFRVPLATFAEARGRIVSNKSRLMTITPGSPTSDDLRAAIRAGIADCVAQLGGASDSFSLPTLRKWARLMTDGKNDKGWLKVFAERRGLYSTLKSIYENIAVGGTRAGLRAMYADFLDEAAPVIEAPALADVAKDYRALAAAWLDFAESALPGSIEPFQQTRRLLLEKDALLQRGQDGQADMIPVTEALNALQKAHGADVPLTDAEMRALFESLQAKLTMIYEAEVAAARQLEHVMKSA